MGTRRISASMLVVLLASLLALPATAEPADTVDVIVVTHDRASARQVATDHGAELRYVYTTALTGFAAAVPEGRLRALRDDRRVRYVELDQRVATATVNAPTGIRRVAADTNLSVDIDGADDVRVDVDVAVLDTGVDLDHPDLNVVGGVDCLKASGGPPWSRTYSCEAGGDDGHGHGTHVAGTIAALDDGANSGGIDVVGVAPGARVWAVKVLDDQGSGSTGSVIAGIDWVAANAPTIEIANMSLGGSGESTAADEALQNAYLSGVAFAVAAGNSSKDVDDYWPAGSPWVLTVSALADFDGVPGGSGTPTCRDDGDDTFADFSNFGAAAGQDVDVVGPGVCIISTYPGGGYADGWSGTSMASPHVAGAAALLASAGHSAAKIVGAVDTTTLVDGDGLIETSSSDDWTHTVGTSTGGDGDGVKEPLVDVSASDAEGNPAYSPTLVATDTSTNAPPTPSFTVSCTELACDFDASASTDTDGTISSYAWDFGDGATATGALVSHTYAAAATYTVTLTVTDDAGATDTDVQDVTVASSDGGSDPAPTSVHVHDLAGASTSQGGTWTATATVYVHGPDGDVPGEIVTFDVVSAKGSVATTASCTTDATGLCTVSVDGIPKRDGDVTFTVNDLSTGSLLDSHVTAVTVAKP